MSQDPSLVRITLPCGHERLVTLVYASLVGRPGSLAPVCTFPGCPDGPGGTR